MHSSLQMTHRACACERGYGQRRRPFPSLKMCDTRRWRTIDIPICPGSLVALVYGGWSVIELILKGIHLFCHVFGIPVEPGRLEADDSYTHTHTHTRTHTHTDHTDHMCHLHQACVDYHPIPSRHIVGGTSWG